MKKLNFTYVLIAILSLGLFSCSKDEPGGTATQDVAGEWYVSVDVIGTSTSDIDTITAEDMVDLEYWNVEKGIIRTFNTNSNVEDKIYISDMATFGGGQKGYSNISPVLCFEIPVTINQATGEFATENNDYVKNLEILYTWDESDGEDLKHYLAKVINGKITKKGGTQNNGTPDDTIEFDLYLQNDYLSLTGGLESTLASLGINFTVDHYHVKGIRYSGLEEND